MNGEHVTVRTVLAEGDVLKIEFPKEHVSETLLPEPVPLDILYEDDHVLVVNKQPYVSSIPSREHPSESIANGVISHYRKAACHQRFILSPALTGIHRGDAHRQTSAFPFSFVGSAEKGLVSRRYLAVVHGIMMQKEGTVDAPIGRKHDSIIERMVTPDGQRAVTHFQTEKRDMRLRLQPCGWKRGGRIKSGCT